MSSDRNCSRHSHARRFAQVMHWAHNKEVAWFDVLPYAFSDMNRRDVSPPSKLEHLAFFVSAFLCFTLAFLIANG